MEHPRSPFSAPACLRRLPSLCFPKHGDPDNVPHQRVRPRTRHGLHHEEIEGLWVFGADDAIAYCGAAENKIRKRTEIIECKRFPP